MTRLQQIVEQMESDTLPLEEMLDRYEEGTRLAQFCGEKLGAAEKRIEIIARDANGKPKVAPFEAGAESTPTKPSGAVSSRSGEAADADDISLF